MALVALVATALLTAEEFVGEASADAVQVRAAEHDGYGRLVFNWAAPVGYTAVTEGRQVVIRFQRPIETNLGTVPRSLAKYVGDARVGDDGNSVVLGLKGDVEVRHLYVGTAVVVDLFPAAPPAAARAAAPPPTPAAAPANTSVAAPPPVAQGPAAPVPAGAPAVAVRTGEHADYTRIVFDWTSQVPYTVEKTGTTAVIRFSRVARFDLARLQSRPPKFVSNISSRPVDGGVSVTLNVPESAELKHFLSGPKVVIDIRAPAGATPPVQTARATPQSTPEPARSAAPPAPVPAPPPVAAPTPLRLAPATPASGAAAPAPLAEGSPTAEKTSAESPSPETKPAGEKPVNDAARPTPLVPARTQGSQAASLAREVTATSTQGGAVSLRFDWLEPVAAAVFNRAGALWVVFDKDVPVDLEKLRAAGGNVIRGIERVPAEGATALRFATIAGVNAELKRNGLSWILEFGKSPVPVPTPISLDIQPNSPIGARVFMPVPEPGNALAVIDPVVLDTLVIVPVIPLGHGIPQRREFAQFGILPTAQGIVVVPKIDDLRVRPLSQGVELSSATRLQMSPVTPEVAASANVGALRPLTRMFELEREGRESVADFNRTRQRLQFDVAKAEGDNRDKARMRLARFYFSNGYHAEALGVLGTMVRLRPEVAGDIEFLGMVGAASMMMGRFEEAHAILDKPLLNDNDEALFWRAALQGAEGDLTKPANDFRRLGAIIRPYPKALKVPLGMMVVDSFLTIGDVQQAQRSVELIGIDQVTPSQKAQVDFIVGKMKAMAGDIEGALVAWDQARAGPHRPTRAKVTVARAELLLRLNRMTRAEVIDEYEKLRFTWRGDDFEFNLLRRLGRLYLEEGDYRSGLRTLRQAVTHFRDNKDVPQVTQLMAESFANIYLGNAYRTMAPVAAIALYEEFKELTPAGDRGDLLVRRLADKLAEIELFDRAAELLENQIQFRLKGLERAQVGTRLALIYFFDRKFPKSLAALDKTNEAGMPADLNVARRLLRARILVESGRGAEMLVLLKDDKSMEADIVRLEYYWGKNDWTNAAQTLRQLVEGSKAEPEKPLDKRQSDFVLNYAVALTLSGNQRGINVLRRDFGRAMAQTENAAAFQLIASAETQGVPDYRNIAEKVQTADKFRGFMSAYLTNLSKEPTP